jgi:glycolate oxidase iron-sulfur subunit
MATAGHQDVLAPAPQPTKAAGVDYQLFLDCVHCGLCLSSCPTYAELGTETDGPRGRIYLMRALADKRVPLDAEIRGHLDLCLGCRCCESACPSGVQYGRLIESFRIETAAQPSANSLSWSQRAILFHIFPYVWRVRFALWPIRLLQASGLSRLLDHSAVLRWLPRRLRQMYEMLPPLQRHHGRLPEILPAEGKRRARVALFVGCVADAIFPDTTIATIRVLQRNGCEVWIPRDQGCCGALHYHAGRESPAKRLAAANAAAFSGDRFDVVIVNAAGCGAMLKDYGHLLSDEPAGQKLARKVRDITEFLLELGPVRPTHPLPLRATYHDACHLCHGQQIRLQPRRLLEMIPGLELVPLNESELCCGAAGSYNLSQPEMAEKLGQRKVDNILASQPQAVFAGNVGCLLQIAQQLRRRQARLWTAHPVDALWASYSGELPRGLTDATGNSVPATRS